MKRVIIASVSVPGLSSIDMRALSNLCADQMYEVYQNYENSDQIKALGILYDHVQMIISEDMPEEYSQALVNAALEEGPEFKEAVYSFGRKEYSKYYWRRYE